jgi:hypothetical protein
MGIEGSRSLQPVEGFPCRGGVEVLAPRTMELVSVEKKREGVRGRRWCCVVLCVCG